MSEHIWWCETHRSGRPGETKPKVCDEGARFGVRFCRMVERMLNPVQSPEVRT